MNKYTEANKRLALALGWADIVEVDGALLGTPPDGGESSRGQAMVPDWCGDWRECGPMMTCIDVVWYVDYVIAICGQEYDLSRVYFFDNCDDKGLSARLAICAARSEELEADQ